MQKPIVRIFQRYLVPRFIASIYFSIRYRCLVSIKSQVQLSSNISFGRGTVVKPFAVIQTQTGRIRIGSNSAVSSFDHLSTGTQDLIIGDNVRIAPNVTLLGGTRNFRRKDILIVNQGSTNPGLTIGDDVLIGANVVVLPGCHIGEGAVIGAGSVVDREVAPYSIVAGVPAREVGSRS